MKQTKRWTIKGDLASNEQIINEAARLLIDGHTVAFPTETVYGLGANALNEVAVSKIFKAKGRPEDNPLIAHVATKKQLQELISHLPPYAEKLIDAFSPGPITFVLPSNGTCAKNVTAGLSTVAVRIPSHPVAQQLLKVCKIPIAAPSANISGKPSPTTAAHVWSDLKGRIRGVLDGGSTGIGMESTVVDCTGSAPMILRPGAISKEEIETVVGPVITDSTSNKEQVSPSLKYKHYQPEVPLWIVEGSPNYIQSIIDEEQNKNRVVALFASSDTARLINADQVISLGTDLSSVANQLYETLRQFKKGEVDLIISESFPEIGIGHAIMNRLRKAASKYIKE